MSLHIELTCESPRLYEAWKDGIKAGSLELSEDLDYVEMVYVKDKYARQGIATAMYDYVEADLGYTLKPSQWLTRDGAAFRSARASKNIEPTLNNCSRKRLASASARLKIEPTVHDDGVPYASAYAHARRLSSSIPGAFSLV